MRAVATFLTLAFLLPNEIFAASHGSAEAIEATIRRLDLAEANAVLRADFDAVEKLWAQDMVVNNPFNKVVKASAGPVRTSALTYSSFVRNIESIQNVRTSVN